MGNLYKFSAVIFEEDDGSLTASLNEIDIIVNSSTLEEVKTLLAEDLLTYAKDYYNKLELWSKAPNRKVHLTYILHILAQNNIDDIESLIEFENHPKGGLVTMKTVTLDQAIENFEEIIDDISESGLPARITTEQGNVVLLREQEYKAIIDTIDFLTTIEKD